MWRADADPRVLPVTATSAAGPDTLDIMRFGPSVCSDAEGEHVRFMVHGETFRLDVVAGSITDGPIRLAYMVARDRRLARRIDTILRLERRLAGVPAAQPKHVSRLARSAKALRAFDARTAGASLKEIAEEMLGPGEWPGLGEWRKSATRRLVVMGQSLVDQGPLPILAW